MGDAGSVLHFRTLLTQNNEARGGGGALFMRGGKATFEGATQAFGDTATGTDGGGFLLARAATINIADALFVATKATKGAGGVVVAIGSTLDIKNSVFDSAVSKEGSGGAIITRLCDIKITNSSFINNLAVGNSNIGQSWGGALAFTSRTTGIIKSTTFDQNKVMMQMWGGTERIGGAAGAISCDGCAGLTILSSTFTKNIAGRAGAIFWNEYHPLLDTATWNLKNGNKALYRNFIGSGPATVSLSGWKSPEDL